MEISKKKHKAKILSSMFHTKKQRTRKHQADSGHDEGLNITPTIFKTPSIVLSASRPIPSEQKRENKKNNDPTASSSVLTPSQQIQLLTVSSPSLSHEPSRTRSTSRMSSMSSLHTGNLSITSLRSAYSNGDDMIINNTNHHPHSNEQAPSIIRSDRVHRYHFETPTNASHHNNYEDGASSRFSYNATHQLESSSSSSSTSSLQNSHDQHHQQPTSSQRHASSRRFAFKRPYFSSSFNSFHLKKSLTNPSNNNNRNSTSVSVHSSSSSTSRRVARINNVLFMGRSLPDFETLVYCSSCEKWIQSRLRYRSGAMVWLAAFVLLMCTVIFFWIPFYTKYFKDTIHYCPACGGQVGRHNAL